MDGVKEELAITKVSGKNPLEGCVDGTSGTLTLE